MVVLRYAIQIRVHKYTSDDFIAMLKLHDIKISMDGKGSCMDNIFIERLWRSLKYECVYLQAFDNGLQVKEVIKNWVDCYNCRRPHSSFDGHDEVYNKKTKHLAIEKLLTCPNKWDQLMDRQFIKPIKILVILLEEYLSNPLGIRWVNFFLTYI